MWLAFATDIDTMVLLHGFFLTLYMIQLVVKIFYLKKIKETNMNKISFLKLSICSETKIYRQPIRKVL